MTSKQLIAELLRIDPEGTTEVCVGNAAIYNLEDKPAYWDGRLQVLIQDHSKDPYYNVVGAKFVCSGSKIEINTLSVEGVIENDPDAVIDFSELERSMPSSVEHYKGMVEEWRKEIREIRERVKTYGYETPKTR